MTLQRWKLTIEYDGRPFAGWQRQTSGLPTVQQAIEDALRAFCQQDITIFTAGRTDAGVHAAGQIAHFDLDYGDRPLTGFTLAKALNAHLQPLPVCILKAEEAAPSFHARFDAVNKLYIYRILSRSAPAACERGLIWHVFRPLDVAAMRQGAAHLLGRQDFTSFRDSACQAKTPIRTLDRFDIETRAYDSCGGIELRCHVEGRSFLHHQVRNMVGTLKLVGEGKWPPLHVKTILELRDRREAGPTAPPDGLSLVRIDYPS